MRKFRHPSRLTHLKQRFIIALIGKYPHIECSPGTIHTVDEILHRRLERTSRHKIRRQEVRCEKRKARREQRRRGNTPK